MYKRQAYLAFLQEMQISYLFVGKDTLDFTLAVQKLKKSFGIEKLKLSGGGILNWSFANEGLIDELSLIVAPVADGDPNTPTVFERSEKLPYHGPVRFTLKSAEPVSYTHLDVYKRQDYTSIFIARLCSRS